MNLNRYITNIDLEAILNRWASEYPQIFLLDTIGRSYEDRPIYLACLTNQESGPHQDKPAIWLDANIHATEIAGTTTVLHALEVILEGYGKSEKITRLLDFSAIYAVPRLNPDGAELAMSASPRFLRSGVRPYPYEDRADGLHLQDIDCDGRILQMRIPDQSGNWKVSKGDSRLMEKRKPDEHNGQYYRLLPEGMIHAYDGHIIPIAPFYEGLDFNRNFPFEWRPESKQKGAGPYPASEPEIRAAVDFISRHENINLALTFHTFSGVILRPYSTRPDEEMDTDDLWVFKEIGDRGTELTGYPNISVFHDFKYHPKEVITGGFDDWMYDHLGIFTFTIELWDLIGRAGIEKRDYIAWFRNHPHEDDVRILQWIDQHGDEGAYVDWYPYQHPQLGPVELGGWNSMYTWRNPPKSLIGEEAARNTPFILALTEMLPHLEIRHLELSTLGREEYRLELVVENTGYLPTYSSNQGKQNKPIRPVRVELELPPNVEIVTGKSRLELGHLEGRSKKRPAFMPYEVAPTDNRARAEWVLRGSITLPIKLTVISERAGKIAREIYLGEN